MFEARRLKIAVFMGFLCGVACFFMGKYLYGLPLGASNLGFILLNRAMIGFAVGISNITTLTWSRHGALMGAVVGAIFAYADAMLGFSWVVIVSILCINPIFGIIIEFGTTVLFGAPIKKT